MSISEEMLRGQLAELAKAIGDRQLELHYGQPIVYRCALADISALATALIEKVDAARIVEGARKGSSRT